MVVEERQVAAGREETSGSASGPVSSPIEDHLAVLLAKYRTLDEGQVATYIPELAKADPTWFGICIATADGHVYEVGDARQEFTIQSISKPFTYGLALEDQGRASVLAKVGVEPTGDAFNSISLEPGTGRPLNPMINAGAIATTSMVAGDSPDHRLGRLLDTFSALAGRTLSIDEAVYRSEKATGHRNRAISYMLRNFDILADEPESPLDLYFRQCSISVTCRDLAVMAATLANEGTNPITGERALRSEFVESVLSVMMSCGMYDYAGEWLYRVGIPAKSGVAGGILAVLPGQLGLAVFSPRLDARGNSVRGIRVCEDLSRSWQLHSLRVPRSGRSVLRGTYDGSKVRSKRLRREDQRRLLDRAGVRSRVYELQGDLVFGTAEIAVRAVLKAIDTTEVAIIDCKRVSHVDEAAARLFLSLATGLIASGRQLALANVQPHQILERTLSEGLHGTPHQGGFRVFPDLDRALEWYEDRLVRVRPSDADPSSSVSLADHDLCRGLTPSDLALLEARMTTRKFQRGDVIVRAGEAADEIFLIMQGEVSVAVELAGGRAKRVATQSAGMIFGELALFRHTTRSADVRADGPVECYVLTKTELDRLRETHPKVRMVLLENLLRNVADMLALLQEEVTALAE